MDTKSFFIYPTTASEPVTPTAGFLDDAGETEWNILLSYVQTRHLRAGETIFTEGDIDRALYVLAIGQLEQSSSQAPTISVDAPAPLNEVAFLDGGRCTTTARAVTEGEFAMRLGLPAAPAAAEAIIVERDIRLVEMTGARYHFGQISTRAALDVIASAKERGLPVTCGVAAHHLALNELDVGSYLTFMKVKPPLRSEADRAAMVEGVASGLIDVIASSHDPQAADTKRQTFAQAAFGAVGLETLLPVALGLHHDGRAHLSHVLKALTAAPAKIFGLDAGTLAKGAPADLVLIDPDEPFTLRATELKSRAQNSPFDGKRFHGRAVKTFVGGVCVFDRRAKA